MLLGSFFSAVLTAAITVIIISAAALAVFGALLRLICHGFSGGVFPGLIKLAFIKLSFFLLVIFLS